MAAETVAEIKNSNYLPHGDHDRGITIRHTCDSQDHLNFPTMLTACTVEQSSFAVDETHPHLQKESIGNKKCPVNGQNGDNSNISLPQETDRSPVSKGLRKRTSDSPVVLLTPINKRPSKVGKRSVVNAVKKFFKDC